MWKMLQREVMWAKARIYYVFPTNRAPWFVLWEIKPRGPTEQASWAKRSRSQIKKNPLQDFFTAGVGCRTVNGQENSTSGMWLCPLVGWYNSTCKSDLFLFFSFLIAKIYLASIHFLSPGWIWLLSSVWLHLCKLKAIFHYWTDFLLAWKVKMARLSTMIQDIGYPTHPEDSKQERSCDFLH